MAWVWFHILFSTRHNVDVVLFNGHLIFNLRWFRNLWDLVRTFHTEHGNVRLFVSFVSYSMVVTIVPHAWHLYSVSVSLRRVVSRVTILIALIVSSEDLLFLA